MIYEDREEAGTVLAGELGPVSPENTRIIAIPNGGVLVGVAIARKLGVPLDIIVIRKIQIPWNTEAGFGSIASDGSVILNQPLLDQLGISEAEVEAQIKKTRRNVLERTEIYGVPLSFPHLKGKLAVLTDDGLASGVTMEAAVRMIGKYEPASVIVAVPTASTSAVRRLRSLVDGIVCPDIRGGWTFAVASAYRNWYDVSDGEVLDALRDFHDG
jgi:putative phosphoribosyl transferase